MIDQSVQEKLREQYNPDGSALRNVQMRLLDILIEFDRVCRGIGVRYWLDSGTLIGAVRHGGFIPWDDDLDVCMLRKDYLKYRKRIQDELRPPYSLSDVDMKSGHQYTWCRIVDEATVVERKRTDGNTQNVNIWLDVFPMNRGKSLFARHINKLYGRCFRRKYHVINDGRWKYCVSVVLYPFLLAAVSALRVIGSLIDRGNLDHDFGSGFYSKRRICDTFPLGTVVFENHVFPAPANCDAYLKGIFGDYSKLPDENLRQNHDFVLAVENERVE